MISKLAEIQEVEASIVNVRILCKYGHFKSAEARIMIASNKVNSLSAMREQLPMPELIMLHSASTQCIEIMRFLNEKLYN